MGASTPPEGSPYSSSRRVMSDCQAQRHEAPIYVKPHRLGAQLPSPAKTHGNWHPNHKYFTQNQRTQNGTESYNLKFQPYDCVSHCNHENPENKTYNIHRHRLRQNKTDKKNRPTTNHLTFEIQTNNKPNKKPTNRVKALSTVL